MFRKMLLSSCSVVSRCTLRPQPHLTTVTVVVVVVASEGHKARRTVFPMHRCHLPPLDRHTPLASKIGRVQRCPTNWDMLHLSTTLLNIIISRKHLLRLPPLASSLRILSGAEINWRIFRSSSRIATTGAIPSTVGGLEPRFREYSLLPRFR